jgi:hypothetical protein
LCALDYNHRDLSIGAVCFYMRGPEHCAFLLSRGGLARRLLAQGALSTH